MERTPEKEIWFVTGSQHLYGDEVLKQVAAHSAAMVQDWNAQTGWLLPLVMKPVVTSAEAIRQVCLEAGAASGCVGVVVWMHTFSPAKMWIRGLNVLTKPLCHLHTQFNAAIPWQQIDMDFMNLNQSAHGDRELGYLMARMRKRRKIITGHWKCKTLQEQLGNWMRVALGWDELQQLKVARIGDNMREVAVTEGDKVDAQIRFGVSVNGYDTSDVLRYRNEISANAMEALLEEYEDSYALAPSLRKGGEKRPALEEAARIELALEAFLHSGNFGAFTDTFENLGNFVQLPGLAVQRLMEKGYGFGAEGDWKTAALLRAMKVMSVGRPGGTSFMEDYTYHFTEGRSLVLGAHMLEICPSIAAGKPSCEVHPLGIGGKADPVRLVFDGAPGAAINASLVDMGNRFRLLVNEVESVQPDQQLPNLPVARVLWDPMPDLSVAASAWIQAGGAHHTVYSQALDTSFMEDFAEIAGIELVVIDKQTGMREFKDRLRANEVYYHLFQQGF